MFFLDVLTIFLLSIAFSHSQATFAHNLLSSMLISFNATLCLSLPSANQFSPVPTYSDSFCLSSFAHPFLLNLSPSRDAWPIFPNVPSSSLRLPPFPALSGQQACPQTKCFSWHGFGKPRRGGDSSSVTRRGCCVPKPWLCLCQRGVAFISSRSQGCAPLGEGQRCCSCSYTLYRNKGC